MKVLTGNIFESEMQTLVNAINCVGAMGKGLALEFKKSSPLMFRDYVKKCRHNKVRLGLPYMYDFFGPPYIINFPTKDHWKDVSKIEDIEAGLDYIVDHYKNWGVTSLAIPALGCGYGGLKWEAVSPLIYKAVEQMDIPVEIYAPVGTDLVEE